MPRFLDYAPQFRVVNSGGAPIEGPYRLDVLSGAPANLGITLESTEPWYEEERIGPFLNYQWSEVSYLLGYRYFVTLNMTAIEGQAIGGNAYGLTLLDRLYQIMAATQVQYAALQFSLFNLSPFFGVVQGGGGGFHPQTLAGKLGFYTLSLSFKTRDLQQNPQPWARGLW